MANKKIKYNAKEKKIMLQKSGVKNHNIKYQYKEVADYTLNY